MLWKLKHGFPRRTLAFLKALYTSSSARARQAHYYRTISSIERCQTGMSIVWTTVQFVHQRHSRCVASITVPGLPRDTNPIRGLMYADDVAVLLTLSNHCWLRRLLSSNGQSVGDQFGVATCGIISFTGHLAPRLDSPLDIRLMDSVVMGKAYYGLELVGGNKSHLAPLQRQSTRVSDCSWCPTLDCIGPLLVETGLGHFSLAHWYHEYACWSDL
ncbi:hypothetical protein BASA81_017953 [Batrachochytrium salamandrivorans]|nr:hypothetical protein BASA81_017953 [Batrachochytrium salamandrivorans]